MKIEFELNDPRLCNHCPVLGGIESHWCNLRIWNNQNDLVKYINPKTKEISDKCGSGYHLALIRPQKCIDKHGE